MKRHIITALCLCMAYWAWGQITHKTGVPDISQIRTMIEGDSCVRLQIVGAETTSYPGQPELPIYYYTFILPSKSEVTGIVPMTSSTVTCTLSYPIKCTPPAETTGGETMIVVEDDIPQYLTDVLYVVSDGYFDGDIHLVTVAYSPFVTRKGVKAYDYVKIPQFTVKYQKVATVEGVTPITPRNRDYAERVAMIERMVDNPHCVSEWIPKTPTVSTDSVLLGTSTPLPGMGYEYLVITTCELYDATRKLIDWKRSKGIHAGVVCYEDIETLDIPDTQTDYEEINDAAGNLRKYLRHAHANGLQYVFLVAEKGEIPYRKYYYTYCTLSSGCDTTAVPTDFYYTELQNRWNEYYEDYNSYTFTGDIEPDIAVGRLFVSSNEEWSGYIDRLITYERNPGHGNPDYLGKYFTIQSDQMQRNNSGQEAAEILGSCFSNIQTWGEEPSYDDTTMSIIYPKGKDVIDELQNNPCGYFATYAHGGQMSTTTFSGGINDGSYHTWVIRSVENDTITDAWAFLTNNGDKKLEPGAGIDRLDIPANPFIVYSMSCTTMPYDTVLNHVNTGQNNAYNPITVGEAFTAKSQSAIAYLGNTRVGWIGPSDTLHRVFNRIILKGITNLGFAENISKATNKKYSQEYLSVAHNILGCPEIPMWTAIPQKIGEITDTDTVSVTPLFCNNAPVMMLHGDVKNSDVYNQNHSVAKIRQNFYPYYLPMQLQNITLQSQHTVFGGDVEIGRAVKPDAMQGDFVIDEGGRLTIETTGEVRLHGGTTIKPGGTLIIKHVKQ